VASDALREGPNPHPWRPVNIFVPREVAFDLSKMGRVTEQILGRLGCGNCHSGRVLVFHTLEDFVVSPKLEIGEIALGAALK
jgi:hypothetical protein